jgi:hypothetical protein
VVRSTIAIGLSLAGVTCGLTFGYLSMRAVMDVRVFMLMGGLPLLVMLPVTIRGFTREEKRPPGWPVGMPLAHMQRVAARVQPVDGDPGRHGGRARAAREAPRARRAHRRRVRGGEGKAPVSAGLRFYWFVVQLVAVAGGIWAGWWLFNWAT